MSYLGALRWSLRVLLAVSATEHEREEHDEEHDLTCRPREAPADLLLTKQIGYPRQVELTVPGFGEDRRRVEE